MGALLWGVECAVVCNKQQKAIVASLYFLCCWLWDYFASCRAVFVTDFMCVNANYSHIVTAFFKDF